MEVSNCHKCPYLHKDTFNCIAVGGFFTAVPAAYCRLLKEYLDTGMIPEEVGSVLKNKEVE